MSVIAEMKSLLGEESEDLTEVEGVLGSLLGFCEETGIELESEEIDDLVSELDEWVEDSDLTDDEREQLAEFAAAIKKLAFKGAKAVGRVAGAIQRAKAKIKGFGHSVKKAAGSGFAAGKRPQSGGKPAKRTKPMRRPTGKPVKRTSKQKAAARKNIATARKKRRK